MILIKLGFTFGGSNLLFFSEEGNNVFKMIQIPTSSKYRQLITYGNYFSLEEGNLSTYLSATLWRN